jgi:hypothetical protein
MQKSSSKATAKLHGTPQLSPRESPTHSLHFSDANCRGGLGVAMDSAIHVSHKPVLALGAVRAVRAVEQSPFEVDELVAGKVRFAVSFVVALNTEQHAFPRFEVVILFVRHKLASFRAGQLFVIGHNKSSRV